MPAKLLGMHRFGGDPGWALSIPGGPQVSWLGPEYPGWAFLHPSFVGMGNISLHGCSQLYPSGHHVCTLAKLPHCTRPASLPPDAQFGVKGRRDYRSVAVCAWVGGERALNSKGGRGQSKATGAWGRPRSGLGPGSCRQCKLGRQADSQGCCRMVGCCDAVGWTGRQA